ncbi:MAG: DUF2723 domain-containing protein [Lentisphaerae bacterium]|nr:DUF2723 domain-containing protein [Lentisphaerota bacterium]
MFKHHTTLIVPFLLSAVILSVYVVTAAPECTFHDSGELISGAYCLGMPHPPSSPTWCILGYIATRVPVGSPAFRVHIMCGFFATVTCLLLYFVVLQWVGHQQPAIGQWWKQLSAVVSALVLAIAPGFWEKAVQAEIYTLNSMFFVLIILLLGKWHVATLSNDQHADRMLVWIAFIFGIGAGNYMALLYYVPVIALAVVITRIRILADWRLVLKTSAMFVCGLCIYLYLPLRSLADPPLDWGNPESLPAFLQSLRRNQWGPMRFSARSIHFIAQWLRTYDFAEQIGLGWLILATVGFAASTVRKRFMTSVVTACFLAYGILMMLMQATTSVLTADDFFITTYVLHEFHIPLYTIIALFSGIGFHELVTSVHARIPRLVSSSCTITIVTLMVLSAIGWTALSRADKCDYSNFSHAHEFALEILKCSPENAWIFPWYDNALFTMFYMKVCENVRQDVRVLKLSENGHNKLTALLNKRQATLSDNLICEFIQSNPEQYLEPRLTQHGLINDRLSPVVFVGMPEFAAFWTIVHPNGIVFRLNSSHIYDRDMQITYWKELLSRPQFRLETNSKANFRENMVIILRAHALWHFRTKDYEIAKYLYAQAYNYSIVRNPEILSYVSACMLELGEFEETIECAGKVLLLDPTHARALNLMGIAHIRLGAYDNALTCFETAAKHNPNDIPSQNNVRQLRAQLEQAQHPVMNINEPAAKSDI